MAHRQAFKLQALIVKQSRPHILFIGQLKTRYFQLSRKSFSNFPGNHFGAICTNLLFTSHFRFRRYFINLNWHISLLTRWWRGTRRGIRYSLWNHATKLCHSKVWTYSKYENNERENNWKWSEIGKYTIEKMKRRLKEINRCRDKFMLMVYTTVNVMTIDVMTINWISLRK